MLGAHADVGAAMLKCLFGDDELKAKSKEALPAAADGGLAGLERMLERLEKKFYRNAIPGADFIAPPEFEVIAREQVANVELTLTFEGECRHDTTQPAHFQPG